MRRAIFIFLCFSCIFSLMTACVSEPTGNGTSRIIEVDLQEMFWLNIGQRADIKGEELSIIFEDVLEDSRCPFNVYCIWEGRASCQVRFIYRETEYSMILNMPGLTDVSEDHFMDYTLTYTLEPYPKEGETTARDDYLMRIAVARRSLSAVGMEDEAKIYAAVIRQLYEVDHTLGSSAPDFPVVYLVYYTDDGVGDPSGPQSDSRILAESLLTAITDKLDDIPAEIFWVNDRKAVPLENGGRVKDSGVIITIGNIHPGENETVLVSASIYIANLAAGGQTYIIERQDGVWQVIGNTGVQWIS